MDQEETAGWMVFPLGERRQPVRNFQEEMENIQKQIDGMEASESRQSCDHWDRVDR